MIDEQKPVGIVALQSDMSMVEAGSGVFLREMHLVFKGSSGSNGPLGHQGSVGSRSHSLTKAVPMDGGVASLHGVGDIDDGD